MIAYLFVGGTAFLCDAGTLLILRAVLIPTGVGSITANLIGNTSGFCLGLLVNYFLSLVLVFDAKSNMKDFIAVLAIGIVGLAITDGGVVLFNNILGIHIIVTKIIVNGIALVWNYGARKLTIYKGK